MEANGHIETDSVCDLDTKPTRVQATLPDECAIPESPNTYNTTHPCDCQSTEITIINSNAETKPIDVVNNLFCDMKLSDNASIFENEHLTADKENEELNRVLVSINRKSRPLIKHIHSDDKLRISEHVTSRRDGRISDKVDVEGGMESNLSNWEDLFDENGEIQQEIIEKVTTSHTNVDSAAKNTPNNCAYSHKYKYLEDLEHVIELYDFPASFKTQDIMQLYHDVQREPMYLKWCDDTHALLVLSTPAQAQRALQLEQDIIKSRPLTQASSISASIACKSDLKPALKRPPTNMQTARRLITGHLGTKVSLSKEEQEMEKQALKNAREQRRIEKQNERDAWEGNLKSTC